MSDTVVRSQSGRILTDTLQDGSTQYPASYTYDGAGRLTGATLPNHVLSYGFGTASCGAADAGKNGNRTTFSDAYTTPTATGTLNTSYCYDSADRLTGTTNTGAPTGSDAIQSTNLSTTGATPNLVYDPRGNTTLLADQTIQYDQSDRHTSTTTAGTTVSYIRDVTSRIVARTITPAGGTATTVRYGFNDGGDSPDWTLDGTGAVLEHTMALPGGVIVSIQQAGGSWVWSYPNIHGDVVVKTGGTGTRSGQLAQYDPFGNPIDPATGLIGTTSADDAVPANTPQNATYGWEGSNQKLYEHEGSVSTIEMGVRQYIALLGRFLSPDPISGGKTSSYNYPNDPLSFSDLTGNTQKCDLLTCDYARYQRTNAQAQIDFSFWELNQFAELGVMLSFMFDGAPLGPPIKYAGVGVEEASGGVIKGFTQHSIDQLIDRPGGSLPFQDAITIPSRAGVSFSNIAKGSTSYIGKTSSGRAGTVVVNSRTGYFVTGHYGGASKLKGF